jgi:hypothetical protein
VDRFCGPGAPSVTLCRMRRLAPAVLLLFGLAGCGHAPVEPASLPEAPVPSPSESAAVLVLRRWDEARAHAYASGSAAQLRRLYVERAPAGASDVRRLRAYAARGLTVSGMRMQLLSVQVLSASARSMRLRVTDRLVGAVAHGRSADLALPRDAASTHTIVLRRGAGGWLVATVGQLSEVRCGPGPLSSGARR